MKPPQIDEELGATKAMKDAAKTLKEWIEKADVRNKVDGRFDALFSDYFNAMAAVDAQTAEHKAIYDDLTKLKEGKPVEYVMDGVALALANQLLSGPPPVADAGGAADESTPPDEAGSVPPRKDTAGKAPRAPRPTDGSSQLHRPGDWM